MPSRHGHRFKFAHRAHRLRRSPFAVMLLAGAGSLLIAWLIVRASR